MFSSGVVFGQSSVEPGTLPYSSALIDCYPGQPRTSETAVASTASSTNGAILTPKGNLKVLVIFAGYNEEAALGCASYDATEWPNTNAVNNPGVTLPPNLGSYFYTAPSQFNLNATDQSFSNFFYQMSRTSSDPFKVTFGYLPARINVDYSTFPYLPNATAEVIRRAVLQYPNFDWQSYDQRTNAPNYASDNSSSAPDGKLDYVVVCFRTFTSCGVGQGGSTGYAAANFLSSAVVPIANGRTRTYTLPDGHVQAGGSIDRSIFLHEFAHNLYNAPHQLGANGTCGTHFDSSQGWGMMCGIATSFSANAWERWYNGWTELKTGANQAVSDIQNAASLAATNGVYTLRDYVTTGDVMRIKIPNTGQYLWLENRAKNGPFDRRHDQIWQYGGDLVAFPPAPVGLLAMVESLSDRTVPITYNDIFNPSKVSQLRPVSAQGNADYVANGPPSSYNNHFWGNLLYNFTPSLNASGGVSEITNIRLDKDNNNTIRYAGGHGNNDLGAGNEMTWMAVAGGQFRDGTLGPNIGTRAVGFRYGLDTNPMLTNNPVYDPATQQSGDLALSGLSVQITAYDVATGDLTIKVRYDDTELRASATRWTGQLRTYPVANATQNAAIWVQSGRRLTLDRGLSPQRSNKNANGDFVNDTRLTIGTTTRMRLESAANLDLRGQGTTLFVESGGSVSVGGGGKTTAYAGTIISVQNTADLGGSVELKAGAQRIVRSTGVITNGPVSW